MWFDNVYGTDLLSRIGGLLIAFATIPLALWTVGIWSKARIF
jgi:hypothetical protein